MKWLSDINWEAMSAIASWTEIFLIIIPAIVLYIYYKFSYVNFWLFDQTLNGVKVVIHNKSKNTLFILNAKLIIRHKWKNVEYDLPVISDTQYSSIKPDNVAQFHIDYAMYEIKDNDIIKLRIQFGGKCLKKHKKVKRNRYVHKSRKS